MKAGFKLSALALLAAFGSAAALAGEKFALPSGGQAEILQAGSTRTADGWSGYTLKYRTSLPLEPVAPLRKEADEMWERYADAAEKSGYQNAVISANVFEKGFILTYHKSHSFLFEKRDGGWRSSDYKDGESGKIEENFLKEVLDRIDAAYAHKAANALLLYMASDWVIADSQPREGGDRTETLNRAAYLDRIREASAPSVDLKRKRDIVKITVTEDGRGAQVESVVTDAITANGRETSGAGRVIDFFEVRDRALIWTKSARVAQ